MKFDSHSGGSDPAYADTCGDAIQAIEPKSATHSSDGPARQIIPAYLESDQATLVDFVRRHMSFLRATSLNRIIKAIKRPQNQLFNRLYPEILNIEDGSYICFSNDLLLKGKNQGQIVAAINRQIGPSRYRKGFRISQTHYGSARSVVWSTLARRRWKGSRTAGMWY